MYVLVIFQSTKNCNFIFEHPAEALEKVPPGVNIYIPDIMFVTKIS